MCSLKITKKHHKHFNNPFPGAPTSLPLIRGNLVFNSQTVPSPQRFPIGNDFEVSWNTTNGGSLSISHRSQPERAIWSTIPGQAFVSAAVAQTRVEESRGSFVVEDVSVDLVCHHQTIQDIRMVSQFDHDTPSAFGFSDSQGTQFPAVLVSGWLFNTEKRKKRFLKGYEGKGPSSCAKYWVLFEQKCNHQVGFQVKIGPPNFEFSFVTKAPSYKGFRTRRRLRWFWPRGFVLLPSESEAQEIKEFNRVCLTYSSDGKERFYGFGEQFSYMEFKGKRVPIFVQEQGIGRGDQPITFAANLISYRAGGDRTTTYAPSPFYMTSKMKSLYLEGYNYCVFDLTQHDRVQIQIHGDLVAGRILHGNSPTELVECFTETVGRPPTLPDWIISGAVVGMQGGTESVRRIWNELESYNVPISAFWLQDWVGQRETLVGSQLWWNWEVDSTRYSGWQHLIKDLSAQHIKVMTYCNPCLAPCHEKPNRKRSLFEEAKKLGILVKDKHGEPYMVPNTAFDVGMLDLTHPDTGNWFKQILQEMVDDGVRGWMADFGEGLPVDAILYSGQDPISAHNKYPELWAQINREFVEEWKANHAGIEKDPQEALVFFMRAGFRDSPKWGMLFWEGDQMVSWQIHDGIKSAVVGLLSSGISGSEELLLRWMELNAFTTVFRTHEGNKPSGNSQFYSNKRTLAHFARFAKVYKAWKFYRIQLVKEAAHRGLPVCRHLFLHYPNDEHVHKLSYQQFLIGTEILVVPVLDKGMNDVKAYFPTGNSGWQHVWTGKQFSEEGFESIVEAQIGYPAVFVKTGSVVGETFLENLRDLKIL
ncbi:uncharacterized protein LOC126798688 isoform X2 [Argentina anserina]|uniref:uncharacterized protein LOC126798688 isoform X2 n=1 Tax=Argentina anserina TaxID=57926 RepID=UPI00217682AE|nr:uncharacterized protein LOC126798688 isoform X2 [Potentilla anserina]